MDRPEEQLDYGEEDHANANSNANGDFAIRGAAAQPEEEEEIIPDDEEYDDLYQDVNAGFIEPHRHHFQNPQTSVPIADAPPQLHISPPLPDVVTSLPLPLSTSTTPPPEEESPRFRGLDLGRRAGGESTSGHRGSGPTATAAGTPTSTPRGNPDYSAARATESGITVFVGELHWWTTDAELETALSEYGRVKEVTFFQEMASGKSKGFCQVHFYDSAGARACKEGMNGRVFNGRACFVAFKSPRSLRYMSAANARNNKRSSNDGGSARVPEAGCGYDSGRNNGWSGWGKQGQSQGRSLGQGRGRSGKGGGNSGGGHYGQGLLGPMGMQPHSQPGHGLDSELVQTQPQFWYAKPDNRDWRARVQPAASVPEESSCETGRESGVFCARRSEESYGLSSRQQESVRQDQLNSQFAEIQVSLASGVGPYPALVKAAMPWTSRRRTLSEKDKVLITVKRILNKLTPEKFGMLKDQLINAGIVSADILQHCLNSPQMNQMESLLHSGGFYLIFAKKHLRVQIICEMKSNR